MAARTVQVKEFERLAADNVVWKTENVTVPAKGLPVNVIIGQTGTGKTSLINMLAGGTPTVTSTASDTKHCTLYKVTHQRTNKEAVLLDTVGLIDTASTDEGRMAFIHEMIRFIQENNLNVCRVFVTIPLGGKQMTEIALWLATLIEALGGEGSVSLLSHWVLTKYNMDSRFNKKMCADDKESKTGTYCTLKQHELGFEVVTHGEENQDEIFEKFVSADSGVKGLDKAQMDADTEHHANMVKNVRNLQAEVDTMKRMIDNIRSDEDFQKQKEQISDKIDQAATDLSNCWISKAKKAEYNKLIADAYKELKDCDSVWNNAKYSRESKVEALKKLNYNFEKKLEGLEQREGLMKKLCGLVGIASDAAGSDQEVLGLAASSIRRMS